MRGKLKLLLCILIFNATFLTALDFWQYPELAEKHSIFAGGFVSSFLVPDSFGLDVILDGFSVIKPDFFFDYLLPVGLPFSVGFSVNALNPSFKSFSLRPGYHINLGDENTDLYVLYTVSIVSGQAVSPYVGEYLLLEFGTRLGLRRRFGKIFCLTIESGFKFESIHFGLSLKVN